MALTAGNRIKFAEASTLADHPYSCIHIETDRYLDIRVPMSSLSSVDSAIKEAVIELMNRNIDSLDGILIAYSKLRLVSPNVDLSEVLGVFQDVRIYGTFAIFRPRPGRLLEGIVFRVNPSHIGCMVHKSFTTSLKLEKGNSNMNLNGLYDQGQTILFKVTKLEQKNNLCYIRGLLTKELIESRRTGVPMPVRVEPAAAHGCPIKAPSQEVRHRKASDHAVAKRSPDSGCPSEPSSSAVPSSSEVFTESDAASTDLDAARKKHKKRKRHEVEEESVVDLVAPAVELDTSLPEPELPVKKKKRKKDAVDLADEGKSIDLMLNNDSAVELHSESLTASDPDVRRSKKKRRKTEHEPAGSE